MAKQAKVYYNFKAPSAVSFKVMHLGRETIIRFSSPYNCCSRFLTEDKELADKIMQHRWFRKGLITMTEERDPAPDVAPEEDENPQKAEPAKPLFTLGGKMAGAVPDNTASVSAEFKDEENGGSSEGNQPDAQVYDGDGSVTDDGEASDAEFTLDSVTSFTEAKEYLVQVHDVPASSIKSKLQLASVCASLGIEFPNYKIN